MEFDLTTWAGISAATLMIVSLLKVFAKKIVDGREELTSGLVGLVLGIAALTSHTMAFAPGASGWLQAIVGGLSAGVAAGVGHDKLWNPVLSAIGMKKPPVGAGAQQPGDSGQGGNDGGDR